MKKLSQLLAVLAAAAAVIYVIVNYGDKITAWCRKLCPCCKAPEAIIFDEPIPADEVPVEEVPAQEPTPVEATDTVAEEADFEG